MKFREELVAGWNVLFKARVISLAHPWIHTDCCLQRMLPLSFHEVMRISRLV